MTSSPQFSMILVGNFFIIFPILYSTLPIILKRLFKSEGGGCLHILDWENLNHFLKLVLIRTTVLFFFSVLNYWWYFSMFLIVNFINISVQSQLHDLQSKLWKSLGFSSKKLKKPPNKKINIMGNPFKMTWASFFSDKRISARYKPFDSYRWRCP